MNCTERLVTAMILASGISIVSSGFTVIHANAATGSADPTPATVVLRGAIPDPAPPSSATEGGPVVLRGSPESPVRPPATTQGCSSGYNYDATHGCIPPDYVSQTPDWNDWPYYGFDGFFPGISSRHRLGRSFRHSTHHGLPVRFGHSVPAGFGRGLAHTGSFGRR
jgi:hypothetical protein